MIEARRVIVSADEWVVHREIAIIRANLKPEGEAAFLNRYEGLRIIGKNESSVLMEIHGTNDRINELVEELRQVGVSEIVRSGRIAVTRDGNYEHDLTRSLHELPLGASEGPGL
jgi:acetolactate synthase-1/3 small subunit